LLSAIAGRKVSRAQAAIRSSAGGSSEGKAGPYVAALAPLLEQARKEPGTLLYAVHRSADDRGPCRCRAGLY
jgi:hypothetical protein